MNRKDKKELMKTINEFLLGISYYIEELEEKELTKIIVENEIKRFFKKY